MKTKTNWTNIVMMLMTLLAGVLGYADAGAVFLTFATLIAATWGTTQLIKQINNFPQVAIQITSWLVGIALAAGGWFLNFGFLAGLIWWEALLWGFGASMVANSVADAQTVQTLIELIKRLLSLFKK